MNQKLFRYAAIDQAGGVGTTPAGTVLELDIPRVYRFRYVWCFFDNSEFNTAGAEAWVRFYNEGQLVIELPAAILPTATTRLGIANYPVGPSGAYQANAPYPSNVGGGAVIWWDNNTSAGVAFACHAFRVVAESDLVRLETNKAGNTRALLAVFSADASP